MLTIFTTLKPMTGHFAMIQRNALRSWHMMLPRPEIIMFDNTYGVDKLAHEIEAQYVPNVKRNDKGVPLVNFMFNKAAEIASNDYLCYANADIILPQLLPYIISQVNVHQFLVIGRRIDLAIDHELSFSGDWQRDLHDLALTKGHMHGDYGIDYFILHRSLISKLDMPDFAIGRPCWDNWLTYRASSLDIPVIDLTKAVLSIHQEHDYSHHPDGIKGVHHGEEAFDNLALTGGRDYLFSISDADLLLTGTGLQRNSNRSLRRRLKLFSIKRTILGMPLRIIRYLLGKRSRPF